jgi:hypothetical protein
VNSLTRLNAVQTMKAQTWFDTARINILPMAAALCAFMFCSGCLQHRVTSSSGYRIDDKSGIPMLLPSGLQDVSSGDFQTVTVTLSAGTAEAKTPVGGDCAIRGAVFSLRPGSSSGNNSWVVQSPSPSGWVRIGEQTDVYTQWRLFVRDLARVHEQGCFPTSLSTQFIRSAIAARIPIPASEVPIFMYSDQGERFVNLVPGMEVRIQQVLPAGKAAGSGSESPLLISTLVYDVSSDQASGVRLTRNHGQEGRHTASLGSKDEEAPTLDQRFAGTSVLRLFLAGISEKESKSDPVLIGTSNTGQLDAVTELVGQGGNTTCVDHPAIACMEFPFGSVSLFSIVWVNGHKVTSPFGAPLSSLFFTLPPPKQAKVLESIRVMRRLDLDRYADIQITRTRDAARQVLLLPGDRIEWKN